MQPVKRVHRLAHLLAVGMYGAGSREGNQQVYDLPTDVIRQDQAMAVAVSFWMKSYRLLDPSPMAAPLAEVSQN